MPAGTTWTNYLTFGASALTAMFAGSQVVHMYYKPMDDLPNVLEQLRKERAEEQGDKFNQISSRD